MWDDSIEMGMRNQRLIELAQHHCARMEFVQSGGQGMAEAATKLPINMRQIQCPVHTRQHGGEPGVHRPGVYRKHCVGCEMRLPTGVVPNLATFVVEQDEGSNAKSQDAKRVAELREEWLERGRVRQALAAGFDDVMASTIRDMAVLDTEPGTESDRQAAEGALARLRALAERAPELFTSDVVGHGAEPRRPWARAQCAP